MQSFSTPGTQGRFAWALTTEILLEYEEVVQPRIGSDRWQDFLALGEAVEARHASLIRIAPRFRFRTIAADPDDNKFADCAIAANASYIITEDHHFDTLHASGYIPRPISPQEFIRRFVHT